MSTRTTIVNGRARVVVSLTGATTIVREYDDALAVATRARSVNGEEGVEIEVTRAGGTTTDFVKARRSPP
jgi:hypothetical protein